MKIAKNQDEIHTTDVVKVFNLAVDEGSLVDNCGGSSSSLSMGVYMRFYNASEVRVSPPSSIVILELKGVLAFKFQGLTASSLTKTFFAGIATFCIFECLPERGVFAAKVCTLIRWHRCASIAKCTDDFMKAMHVCISRESPFSEGVSVY